MIYEPCMHGDYFVILSLKLLGSLEKLQFSMAPKTLFYVFHKVTTFSVGDEQYRVLWM